MFPRLSYLLYSVVSYLFPSPLCFLCASSLKTFHVHHILLSFTLRSFHFLLFSSFSCHTQSFFPLSSLFSLLYEYHYNFQSHLCFSVHSISTFIHFLLILFSLIRFLSYTHSLNPFSFHFFVLSYTHSHNPFYSTSIPDQTPSHIYLPFLSCVL